MRQLGHDDPALLLMFFILKDEDIYLGDEFYAMKSAEKQFRFVYDYARNYHKRMRRVIEKLSIESD